MHQAACSTRAVPRLVALVPCEAGAMRRVQAPIRECDALGINHLGGGCGGRRRATVLNRCHGDDVGLGIERIHDQHPAPRTEKEAKVPPASFERRLEEIERKLDLLAEASRQPR